MIIGLALALAAQTPLQSQVEARLAAAGPGIRFGLVVADESGRELVAIDPDGRFMPASNAKIFTTAAAFATLPALDRPDAAGGAAVRIDPNGDVVLEGHGDARLSGAPDCAADCLATLADAVAAKVRRVRDVVGDDSFFPDQRWSPGMSWNNIPTRSGTAASALTLDDNELPLTVAPSAPGQPPRLDGPAYYQIDNRALTVAGDKVALSFDRAPNSRSLRLSGTIGASARPDTLRLGVDDPAEYAAWTFRRLLLARGVRVTGGIQLRHRLLMPADDPARRGAAPPARPPQQPVLARLVPPPLAEDLVRINKVSQNLHAELMLRRIGRVDGTGSIADGQAKVTAMLARAGVPRAAYDLSDGSGMSSYDRAAPRGVVILLRWIAAQPWGNAWRATLPVGGEGTLARRFAGTPLDHRIFAKTGTLNATVALSGYLLAASGRTLTFSAFANDVPEGAPAARAIDDALQIVTAAN